LAHNLAKSKAATVDVESSLHNAEHARINKLETEFQPAGMCETEGKKFTCIINRSYMKGMAK